MKRLTATVVLLSLAAMNLVGCSDATKSSAKQETTITGPGGKTTITTEKEIKTTGEKPPVTAK